MANKKKIITIGTLGTYNDLKPQIRPIEKTWSEMVALKGGGKLIPGQLYRITDYVTTVSSILEPMAKSAGHAFDIIVLALDAVTLAEEAWAVRHEGDTYFEAARPEAWDIRYTLENVRHSARPGKTAQSDDFQFLKTGTVEWQGETYTLWEGDSAFQLDYGGNAYAIGIGDTPTQLRPYFGNSVGEWFPVTGTGETDEEGKGTILYMKDEWENECPYDFKNVQYKRWMANSGILAIKGVPTVNVTVSESATSVWTYTFGYQSDQSMKGRRNHNTVASNVYSILPNNVFVGNSAGCSTGFGAILNTVVLDALDFEIGNDCVGNILTGGSCVSLGSGCEYNYLEEDLEFATLDTGCFSNHIEGSCSRITLHKGTSNVEIGNDVRFADVLGISKADLTHISFTKNAEYAQVACKDMGGNIVVLVPGGGDTPQ